MVAGTYHKEILMQDSWSCENRTQQKPSKDIPALILSFLLIQKSDTEHWNNPFTVRLPMGVCRWHDCPCPGIMMDNLALICELLLKSNPMDTSWLHGCCSTGLFFTVRKKLNSLCLVDSVCRGLGQCMQTPCCSIQRFWFCYMPKNNWNVHQSRVKTMYNQIIKCLVFKPETK